MTDNNSIKFTSKAYCKIILHAAKYPYAAVNGVLLAKSGSGREIQFVDAIPLFHTALNLTPMAEIALTQIDQVASKENLVIAGYYMAHENLRESSLEKAQHKISEKIAENFPNACLVVVDNNKLSLHMDNIALKVAQNSQGKFKQIDIQRIVLAPEHTLDVCSALMERRAFDDLIDFDNHLDDISCDWRNIELNNEIAEICRD